MLPVFIMKQYPMSTCLVFVGLLIGILCTPFPTLAANTEEEAYTIAVGLYNDGLIDLARDQFKNFLRQFPNSVQAAYVQYLIGECDYRQKKYESAIQEYRKGMTEYPGDLYIDQMAYKLGRSYFLAQNYKSAQETFEDFIHILSTKYFHLHAYYWLGETYFQRGNINRQSRRLHKFWRVFQRMNFWITHGILWDGAPSICKRYQEAFQIFSDSADQFSCK